MGSIAYVCLKCVTNYGTNDQISAMFGSDEVFFAPVFEQYSTGSQHTKKEVASKQAHLM